MWNNNKNLGKIKEGKTVDFFFEADKDYEITSVIPSCKSCTDIISFSSSEIAVSFKAEKIPVHLRFVPGYQQVMKSIIVYYDNGTSKILTFKATIVK